MSIQKISLTINDKTAIVGFAIDKKYVIIERPDLIISCDTGIIKLFNNPDPVYLWPIDDEGISRDKCHFKVVVYGDLKNTNFIHDLLSCLVHYQINARQNSSDSVKIDEDYIFFLRMKC